MASNSILVNTGYDFVNTIPEKLTCSICTNVLSDPCLTECCGQHFCQRCLQFWLKARNKTCPHCRTVNFAHILDKSVTLEINKLMIRCSHNEEGCEWVGELGDLRTHLDSKQGCAYEQVGCPCGCMTLDEELCRFRGARVRRKDLKDHLKNECDQRRYNCKYCGKEDTYKNITEYHYDVCPDFPFDCPNECGVTEIKQKDLPAHQEQCPLEPEQCPFQEAGCETRLVRKDLEEHLTSQSKQHLLLTLRKTQSVEQELRERCRRLEEKNTELERKCRTLEASMRDHEKMACRIIEAIIRRRDEMTAATTRDLQTLRKAQSLESKKNTELEQKCHTLEERCKELEQVVNEHERRLTSRMRII